MRTRSPRPRSFALAVVVSLAPAAMPSPSLAQRGAPAVQFEGQSIDQMVGEFMTANDVPGMTLAIVQAPYVSRVVGYGVSDPVTGRLASPKTLYDVGPMVRAYAAVALLQLAESGRLAIDDPLSKHVTDEGLPESWRGITLRQLLGHSSGIADYTRQPGFDGGEALTPARVFSLVGALPLAFEPGEAVAESATDFFLLALVIERVSAASFERFVEEGQVRNLALKNTVFASSLERVRQEPLSPTHPNHSAFLTARGLIDPTEIAIGHRADGGAMPLPAGARPASMGWGSLYASAEDISLWDIGLAGSLLLQKKESRDLIYSGFTLASGAVAPSNAGWRFLDRQGLMEIRGDSPGFTVYLSRFTDKSDLLCVTLCANKSGLDLSALARRIAGAFDPRLGPAG